MTDELDAIPWHLIGHAYGYATDTPQHLRNLTSPDPEVAEAAHWTLSTTIVHQEWVSDAAIAAFPYLLHLLLTSSGRTRSYVLFLVLKILEGIVPPIPALNRYHAWDQLDADNDDEWEHDDESDKAIHDDGWDADHAEAQVYPLALAALPSTMPWLHDPDPDLVHSTLLIVACCLAKDGTHWPSIQIYADTESRPTFRAAYPYLAWCSGHPAALAWLDKTATQAGDPLVRFTATSVLARWATSMPDDRYQWFIETILGHDAAFIADYEQVPMTNHYWLDCGSVLYARSFAERAPVASAWLASLCGETRPLWDDDYLALLLLAFGVVHYAPTLERMDLHADVLRWMAHKAFATEKGEDYLPLRILRGFGLPWRPAEINGFLGLPNTNHPGFE
ncbi:MAG: hypothetical protein LCH85_20635 [Chloroflexi bacterium]|nr:hypothetical protein [Chloroflexota bacterium]